MFATEAVRIRKPPRITYLRVENFRALRKVEFRNLTPLTVLLGPNGSGKSTVFDVFAFLSECFETGLRRAWDRRGRAKELKTRGGNGPLVIEIKYAEPDRPLITYHLAIDERRGSPIVVEEWLRWKRGSYGQPFRFLDYKEGTGKAASGEAPDEHDARIDIPLQSADLIAVNALGQFAEHPRVAALREFITGWFVSYLSVDSTRGQPEAGPQQRLSRTGDNLANVIQFLGEQHPDRLNRIFETLRARVPRIEKVLAEAMPDGRLLLSIKDAPFDSPILARFASDGTLKMLAYLVLLYDPSPPPFIGLEEPENFLHPRLLYGLAEECRAAGEHGQLLVTTYSPFFLNALRAKEVRVLYRDEQGYTQAVVASDIPGIADFMNEGGLLGYLWLEGYFGVGDPLVNHGTPVRRLEGGTEHLEFLVEEPSMEAFLTELLPRLLQHKATFAIHVHQGKHDLLEKLNGRLRGYARWLPEVWRIVVLVDRDGDSCTDLKRKLEQGAEAAGLLTCKACGGMPWKVVSRLAIEELESWFFGEWTAVRNAYPRVSAAIPNQAAYRAPDAIAGGTWEALERILKRAGYFSGGLRKLEAAATIGKQFDSTLAKSPSFVTFRNAIMEAVT